jgi:hypothetical protein
LWRKQQNSGGKFIIYVINKHYTDSYYFCYWYLEN